MLNYRSPTSLLNIFNSFLPTPFLKKIWDAIPLESLTYCYKPHKTVNSGDFNEKASSRHTNIRIRNPLESSPLMVPSEKSQDQVSTISKRSLIPSISLNSLLALFVIKRGECKCSTESIVAGELLAHHNRWKLQLGNKFVLTNALVKEDDKTHTGGPIQLMTIRMGLQLATNSIERFMTTHDPLSMVVREGLVTSAPFMASIPQHPPHINSALHLKTKSG